MPRKNLRRAQLAQAQGGQPPAHVDASLQLFALCNTGEEAARERVAGASSVDNLLLADRVYRERLDFVLTLHRHDRGVGALSDDGRPLALAVLLWQVRKVLGDGLDIVRVQVVRVGVGRGLGLVANHVIPVRRRLVERILEELRDEGCREREDEWLFAQ